jgi:hypothetical protein
MLVLGFALRKVEWKLKEMSREVPRPREAVGQAPGSCLTVMLSKFVSESESLRAALMRHELASYALTQQVAACNARHELEERLCRWLMQTRDTLELWAEVGDGIRR